MDMQHSYIAHNVNHNAYLALSNTQLDSCVVVADTHVCHGERLLEKKATSCIVALFTEDGPAAQRYCQHQRQQHSWAQQAVYRQQGSTYRTTTTISVNQTCQGQLTTADSWPLGSSHQVNTACIVEGADFVIMPAPQQLKGVSVTTNTELDIPKALKEVYNHEELHRELAGLRVESTQLEVPEPVASTTWIWVLVGVGIFLVIVVIGLGFAYAVYKKFLTKATGFNPEDLNIANLSPKDIEKEAMNVIGNFASGPFEGDTVKTLIESELKEVAVSLLGSKKSKRTEAPDFPEGEYVPARLKAGVPKQPGSFMRS